MSWWPRSATTASAVRGWTPTAACAASPTASTRSAASCASTAPRARGRSSPRSSPCETRAAAGPLPDPGHRRAPCATPPRREDRRMHTHAHETIAGIPIPDSAVARDATQFVQDTTTQLLYDHSRRVFLWASLQGEQRGLDYDPELLYVGALFHDLGL